MCTVATAAVAPSADALGCGLAEVIEGGAKGVVVGVAGSADGCAEVAAGETGAMLYRSSPAGGTSPDVLVEGTVDSVEGTDDGLEA